MDYEKKYNEALEHARAEILANPGLRKMWEEIFPELRESEDERMRRKTINCLTMHNKGCVDAKDIDECIAWLEKQKEPKKEFHIPDYIGVAHYNPVPIEQKEQKPAEWSKEDETAFGDLLWCIEQARHSAKDENDMGNIWYAEKWLKERLKSIRPQPKQEWNEYDNEMFHCICAGLCHLRKLYEKNEDAVSDYNAMIEWFRNRFKSLRLQSKQEWSKEEETIIEGACSALEIYGHTKLASRLKSLRPSWKPSEEQMDALNAMNCCGELSYQGQQQLLIDLYRQLKKLM